MDKAVIDLAGMGVLKNVLHKREMYKLKEKKGLAFLFDDEGALLCIECVTSHLEAAVYKYQHEMAYIGMICLEGDMESLETVKTMLMEAYHPKASSSYPAIKTIHSGCLPKKQVHVIHEPAKQAAVMEEFVSRTALPFIDSDEAARLLNISVDTLFFYCQHLISSGYSFRKDSHRRYVFLEEDIALLEVFINLLEREVAMKRAAKEAVKLTNKFGVKEALRLSTFTSGPMS